MPSNDLFRIGEVSKLFHISVELLRHYDKIGLLQPEYTDPDSGYRYYSASQFECLNTIRYLRTLGVPLDQINGFLKNRDVERIHTLLLAQKEEVLRQQRELAAIERKIDRRLQQISDALSSELDRITLRQIAPRRLSLLRRQISPKSYLDLEYSIRELEQDADAGIAFLGKVGLGLSAEALNAGRFRPYEIVFLVLDTEDNFPGNAVCLPAEVCACVRFRGSHERAPEYYEKLMEYIRRNRLQADGFSKEITLIDYGLTNDISKFVTEIQIGVKPDPPVLPPGKTSDRGCAP